MSKVYRSCRWIVEKLTKHLRLSFDEINELWMEDDGISDGTELNKRTFHRYQEVLRNVFGIEVVSRKCGDYAYVITNRDALSNESMSHTGGG